MFKQLCITVAVLFSLAHSMGIKPKSGIVFDPVGEDSVHPIISGCMPIDDFTQDIHDPSKFYRCADGVQNMIKCAPGTVFEGLLYKDKLIVVKHQCGWNKLNL